MNLTHTSKPDSEKARRSGKAAVEVLSIRAQAKDTKRSRDITNFAIHMDTLSHLISIFLFGVLQLPRLTGLIFHKLQIDVNALFFAGGPAKGAER
jgi:hypothetical protein